MAAFFIDLDDTIVSHGTNNLLPRALEMLKNIEVMGHQIIFTTYRGPEFDPDSIYGVKSTQQLIDSLGVKYKAILYGIESPRVMINDGGAIGITHPAGETLNYIIGDDPNPITKSD
jgi:hypothetical protein